MGGLGSSSVHPNSDATGPYNTVVARSAEVYPHSQGEILALIKAEDQKRAGGMNATCSCVAPVFPKGHFEDHTNASSSRRLFEVR
jgi:hypothetical protein